MPDPMLRERILRCVERLSSSLREVMLRRVQDGGRHSDTDLAALMGVTRNAFSQSLGRGRDALERCLRRYGINVREYLR